MRSQIYQLSHVLMVPEGTLVLGQPGKPEPHTRELEDNGGVRGRRNLSMTKANNWGWRRAVKAHPAETLALCPFCSRIVNVGDIRDHHCPEYEDCFPEGEPLLVGLLGHCDDLAHRGGEAREHDGGRDADGDGAVAGVHQRRGGNGLHHGQEGRA